MITATSSPDRFGSLLRGLLKKNIPNMVYLALIGFIGIPLPYLLAMFRRWEEKGQWVYENISTADRGGRSEEHTSELSHNNQSRMPSSA